MVEALISRETNPLDMNERLESVVESLSWENVEEVLDEKWQKATNELADACKVSVEEDQLSNEKYKAIFTAFMDHIIEVSGAQKVQDILQNFGRLPLTKTAVGGSPAMDDSNQTAQAPMPTMVNPSDLAFEVTNTLKGSVSNFVLPGEFAAELDLRSRTTEEKTRTIQLFLGQAYQPPRSSLGNLNSCKTLSHTKPYLPP